MTNKYIYLLLLGLTVFAVGLWRLFPYVNWEIGSSVLMIVWGLYAVQKSLKCTEI